MKFYRLQSSLWEVKKGWRSFYSEYSSLQESMKADIERWIKNQNMESIELDKLTDLEIENLFADCVDDGLEKEYTEFGISCYDNIESLINYWSECGFTSKDYFTQDAYILVFEGNYTGEGKDGEDTAEYLYDIERISLVDFYRTNIKIMQDVYGLDEEDLQELNIA